ncbi:MAG: OmpH family outer membrane protein [Bacteroidales bacterium]
MSEEINEVQETHTPEPVNEIITNEALTPEIIKGKGSNKLLLIFNIILFIGLAVLYFLFFTKSPSGDSSVVKSINKINSGNLGIAYINNDSILANYELVKRMRKDLEVKSGNLESEIAAKQKAYEKDAAYFQEQVKNKSISDQSAQEIYQQLMQEQQKIVDLRDRYSADLQQQEYELNVMLLDSVTNFLKRYNARYKFDYILGYNKGGNIFLANDTLNITSDVIREINQEFFSKHPEAK